MAMLAEPRRRKQKIPLDPRNKKWTHAEDGFGKKMLSKMGWSQGGGLGAKEQGMTEAIRLKVNIDSRGLGSKHSSEDNWLAHQDDFEALLQQLNSKKNPPENDAKTDNPKQTQKSLEAISEKTRARIHYKKFTRGKDTARYSSEDMSSIFGKSKREKRKREKDEEDEEKPPSFGLMTAATSFSLDVSSEPSTKKEKTIELEDKEELGEDKETNLKTTTSSLSLDEYFRQKMAQKKLGSVAVETDPTSQTTPEESNSPIETEPVESEEKSKKKKKKRKKDKKERIEEE